MATYGRAGPPPLWPTPIPTFPYGRAGPPPLWPTPIARFSIGKSEPSGTSTQLLIESPLRAQRVELVGVLLVVTDEELLENPVEAHVPERRVTSNRSPLVVGEAADDGLEPI